MAASSRTNVNNDTSKVLPSIQPQPSTGTPRRSSHHGDRCSCGLPNPKFCMLNLVQVFGSMKKPSRSWVPMSICSTYSSTTTPTAPYSSSDLIGTYHGEGGRLPSSEELRIGNGSITDRDPRRRSNGEFEKRPNSRGRENKKSFSYNGKVSERETDSRERHKDDGVIFPPANNNNNVRQVTLTNGIKPSGMRNNFLSGQAIPAPAASRNNQLNSQNSKESDDLVAMGTNWHPPPNGQGPGRTSRGSFGAGSQLSHNSNSGLLGPRKITSRTNMGAGAGQNKKDGKLSEPKYADAMTNAPPSFQQRISELSALEQETIRYERTKKFRRKPKES